MNINKLYPLGIRTFFIGIIAILIISLPVSAAFPAGGSNAQPNGNQSQNPVFNQGPPPDDAHSTTGPIPPEQVNAQSDQVTGQSAPVVVSNVPAYMWRRGCGPTAAGMLLGYWDYLGYDLIPGDASTQTNAVDQAIASENGTNGHYEDYALPMDDSTPSILADKSETGGAHASDSIADFMKTSWSLRGNRYGWSYFNDLYNSLTNYFNYVNLPGKHIYVGWATWSSNLWTAYKNEIDANRPVVFLVDWNGDGYTDHFITAIGYDNSTNSYAAYNTWDYSVHWYSFHAMSSSNPWGIYGMVTALITDSLTTAPVLLSPRDGASSRAKTPTFAWKKPKLAQAYEFQYATDAGFLNDVYDSGSLFKTSIKPPAMPVGDYFWHVRAQDSYGNWSSFSTPRTVHILPLIPAKPVLISSNGFKIEDTTPLELDWLGVPYGDSYELQLDSISRFSHPDLDVTTKNLSYTTSSVAAGTWYWHVRGINVNGEMGKWSKTRLFTIYPTFTSEFTSGLDGWVTDTMNTTDVPGYLMSDQLDIVNYVDLPTATKETYAKDFSYQVRMMRNLDFSSDYVYNNSVTVRIQSSGGYQFDYFDDGYFRVMKEVNGKWTAIKKFTYTSAIMGGDWNTLKVTAIGTSLKYYINGALVWSGRDSSLKGGTFGIHMYNPEWTDALAVDYARLGMPDKDLGAGGMTIDTSQKNVDPLSSQIDDQGNAKINR